MLLLLLRLLLPIHRSSLHHRPSCVASMCLQPGQGGLNACWPSKRLLQESHVHPPCPTSCLASCTRCCCPSCSLSSRACSTRAFPCTSLPSRSPSLALSSALWGKAVALVLAALLLMLLADVAVAWVKHGSVASIVAAVVAVAVGLLLLQQLMMMIALNAVHSCRGSNFSSRREIRRRGSSSSNSTCSDSARSIKNHRGTLLWPSAIARPCIRRATCHTSTSFLPVPLPLALPLPSPHPLVRHCAERGHQAPAGAWQSGCVLGSVCWGCSCCHVSTVGIGVGAVSAPSCCTGRLDSGFQRWLSLIVVLCCYCCYCCCCSWRHCLHGSTNCASLYLPPCINPSLLPLLPILQLRLGVNHTLLLLVVVLLLWVMLLWFLQWRLTWHRPVAPHMSAACHGHSVAPHCGPLSCCA